MKAQRCNSIKAKGGRCRNLTHKRPCGRCKSLPPLPPVPPPRLTNEETHARIVAQRPVVPPNLLVDLVKRWEAEVSRRKAVCAALFHTRQHNRYECERCCQHIHSQATEWAYQQSEIEALEPNPRIMDVDFAYDFATRVQPGYEHLQKMRQLAEHDPDELSGIVERDGLAALAQDELGTQREPDGSARSHWEEAPYPDLRDENNESGSAWASAVSTAVLAGELDIAQSAG